VDGETLFISLVSGVELQFSHLRASLLEVLGVDRAGGGVKRRKKLSKYHLSLTLVSQILHGGIATLPGAVLTQRYRGGENIQFLSFRRIHPRPLPNIEEPFPDPVYAALDGVMFLVWTGFWLAAGIDDGVRDQLIKDGLLARVGISRVPEDGDPVVSMLVLDVDRPDDPRPPLEADEEGVPRVSGPRVHHEAVLLLVHLLVHALDRLFTLAPEPGPVRRRYPRLHADLGRPGLPDVLGARVHGGHGYGRVAGELEAREAVHVTVRVLDEGHARVRNISLTPLVKRIAFKCSVAQRPSMVHAHRVFVLIILMGQRSLLRCSMLCFSGSLCLSCSRCRPGRLYP